MKIAIRYMAQVKMAAGRASDEVEVTESCSVRELLAQLAQRHGEDLRRLLLTATGEVPPTLLLFLGDEQISPEQHVPRRDGDVLTILSPMAGG